MLGRYPFFQANNAVNADADAQAIVKSLMQAVQKYNKQCEDVRPNKKAITRKTDFLLKIDALLRADSEKEKNNALLEIFDFYLKHKESGRLLDNIEDAFISLFKIKVPCKKLCAEHEAILAFQKTRPESLANLRAVGTEHYRYIVEYAALKTDAIVDYIYQQMNVSIKHQPVASPRHP